MRRKGDKKTRAISSHSINPAPVTGQQNQPDGDTRQASSLKIQPSPHFVAFVGLAGHKHNVYGASKHMVFEHFVALSGKGGNVRT
jgi:hypothetical protein